MQAWRSTRELFLFSMLIDKSPLTSNISQLLKRKEKSGLPYPHNRTFWFLVNICIYMYIIYVMHMSEFVFCQTQISICHISAYENDFHLKFWGWSNWPPAMLHTKFQVSNGSGTYFSGTQIWSKSAVNWVLYVYRPRKRFCTFLGFEFGVM